MAAHVAWWEVLNGPVPKGMHLDHDEGCPKNCVNPQHLTPRTPSSHAEKTQLVRGAEQEVGRSMTRCIRAGGTFEDYVSSEDALKAFRLASVLVGTFR
jgi:hypothetical protein